MTALTLAVSVLPMFTPCQSYRRPWGVRKPVSPQAKLTSFPNFRWRGRFPHPHSSRGSNRHYLQLASGRHTIPLSTI